MEIKKDFQNNLFKRQEISGELESEKNPSFEDVKKLIAAELNKPEETIQIKNIKGGFGKDVFHIDANIYETKEDLESIKNLSKTKKQRTEEVNAEKEAKAEADKPKEDAPAEEKTEDKPTDEKTEEQPQAEETKDEPKPAEEPTKDETPVEDKPEEEKKEAKEEIQKAEEAKEN
ncbi:hypothetical protein HOE04_03530 [archaeon]|jgi:ribosomal protein S24E|nr:hypothetical protein [archaeon]